MMAEPDVTETQRPQAGEGLAGNERDLLRLLGRVFSGCLRLDREGRVVAYLRGEGLGGVAFMIDSEGRHLEEILPAGAARMVLDGMAQAGQNGGSERIPFCMRSGGEERVLEGWVQQLEEGDFLLAFRDMTEALRNEAIAHSVSWMNSLGAVFSGLRHEIGNPVNSIKLALNVLREGMDEWLPERRKAYLDRILSEVGRMEYLLQSMRNFNQFEQVRLELRHLRSFLQDFLVLIRPECSQRGITLRTEVEGEPSVRMDDRALCQVLINLIHNSMAAMEGRPSRTLCIGARQEEGHVRIWVKDSGSGMNLEVQKRLFQPFFTTRAEGTGLGLVMVRKLMLQMGGSIEVQSREGQGTRMTLLLPTPSHNLPMASSVGNGSRCG